MKINEQIKNEILNEGGVIRMRFLYDTNKYSKYGVKCLTLDKIDIHDEEDKTLWDSILYQYESIRNQSKKLHRQEIKKLKNDFKKYSLPLIPKMFNELCDSENLESGTDRLYYNQDNLERSLSLISKILWGVFLNVIPNNNRNGFEFLTLYTNPNKGNGVVI